MFKWIKRWMEGVSHAVCRRMLAEETALLNERIDGLEQETIRYAGKVEQRLTVAESQINEIYDTLRVLKDEVEMLKIANTYSKDGLSQLDAKIEVLAQAHKDIKEEAALTKVKKNFSQSNPKIRMGYGKYEQ